MNDVPIEKIPGFGAVAPLFSNKKLYHFSFVRSFLFAEEEDELGDRWMCIRLVMEHDSLLKEMIGLLFERVSAVEFSGFGQIQGLCFQSVVERGWEKLRFEVGDYEEGKIHLYCHAIQFFAVERGWTIATTRST